ncbi:MAG TPA: hypothetical protein VI934_00085 [Candidatus Nanoarchaeia archaeon]|nr:hypothetical protein [Candidatus Nanoarchaeia archaeon]
MAKSLIQNNDGRQLEAGEAGTGETMFRRKLTASQGLQDLFELVKEVVWKSLQRDQAGLMLGLAELGIGSQRVLGAFYSPDANTIVMNKTLMGHVEKLADPLLYKSYCFYILLHEYLHSCGFYDEGQNRQIVAAIAASCFGPGHVISKLSASPEAMLKLISDSFKVVREKPGGQEGSDGEMISDSGIEFVEGIDRRNTNYIM